MTDLPTVVVDGSPVHVLDEGDGPAVLLLHGSGPGTTGSGAWGATAEALGGSWRLAEPRQRTILESAMVEIGRARGSG